MKQVTLDEQREIQLEMLREVDVFCRKNNLRYSLAYGTMLGAIRHKGFIPWDDDVDITMPLPDMLKFKELFKSETIKYCDVDTEENYQFGFSRLVYTKTFSKQGLIGKFYGVCIDLYPVIGLPDIKEDIDNFIVSFNKQYIRANSLRIWRRRIMKLLPINTIPFFTPSVRKLRDLFFTFDYEKSKNFYSTGRLASYKDIFNFDLFENMTDVDFNGEKFMGISRSDEYLSSLYGDYMKLPPVELRVPQHGAVTFWK